MANFKGNKSNILSTSVKLQMVKERFENNVSLVDLSKKYRVSYSTVRKNCYNYLLFGEEALISKTGRANADNFDKFATRESRERKILKEEILNLKEENQKLKNIINEYESRKV
ncbi:hypothetical protein [[Acholeplasma] multilocale]|uniref:hypothetical protein n=1 Tax=[Acholeplasma] multilocale TaxID=264638 RepID=UPI0004101D0B|nr:hypothetical protein [[Acholeplasma] multilocale]